MPLYEYRCESCAHQFEVIQKFSDPHVSVCPRCGDGPVVKLISSPAFTFKGTGFYITDYARKDQEKKDQAKKDQGSSGGSSSSETSEKSEKSDTTDKAAKTTEPKPAAAADTSTAKTTPKADS